MPVTAAPESLTTDGGPWTAEEPLLASVIISTYNRSDALEQTLAALAKQDIPHSAYEVVVVNDGSTDETTELLSNLETPYTLRAQSLPVNRGISAGRNAGMLAARGRYLILLSDDLLVQENFISAHVHTLKRFPDAWIVGGFHQLDDLRSTPFGRFLDALETSFQVGRTGSRVAPGVFEMRAPTARNLSLPRADVARVGWFDERFRVTCEDLDLAQRASEVGIRFLHNAEIHCIHNDQTADLRRYCQFQERGTSDTVRLCQKYPALHGGAAVAIVNGRIRRTDGVRLIIKKLLKTLLSRPGVTVMTGQLIAAAERAGTPDRALFRAYRALIALHTFRGWRTGLRDGGADPGARATERCGSPERCGLQPMPNTDDT